MPEKREAQPGVMKFPAGAKNREEFEALKARVVELEKAVASLIVAVNSKKKA
jgi:BMFP domain-containing protein YqiC